MAITPVQFFFHLDLDDQIMGIKNKILGMLITIVYINDIL